MAGNDDLIAGPEAPLTETASEPGAITPEARAKIAELTDLAAREISDLLRLRTALAERDAQIERLTRERKDFIQTISEWATKAGEAEGRLTASEWPGVVEGWKDRAETAERELAEARAEVERKDATLAAARAMLLAQSKLLHIFGNVEESPFITDIDAALQQSEVKP